MKVKNEKGSKKHLARVARVVSADWFRGLVVGQNRAVQDKQWFVRTSMIKSLEDDMN